MITTRSFIDQTWIDLNSPTKDELDSLILSRDIDPLIAKDLLTPTPKQHTREFGDTIYAVIHIPYFKNSHTTSLEQEIDIVLTKKGMITTRYDSIDALHHFAKQIEVNEILNKENGSHLFFGMMREVYRFLFDEIEYLKGWMKEIEKNIFEGREKEMVFGISTAGRNLLSFQRTITPHELVLSELGQVGENIFDDKFRKDIKLLLVEWRRLIFEIENIKNMLNELRETNNSILSTKQNETMKVFTIIAFITFPLSLIATIFGMNAAFMPIIGLQNDFWLILGLMFAVSIVMFAYFKYKRWV